MFFYFQAPEILLHFLLLKLQYNTSVLAKSRNARCWSTNQHVLKDTLSDPY